MNEKNLWDVNVQLVEAVLFDCEEVKVVNVVCDISGFVGHFGEGFGEVQFFELGL